MDAALEAFAFGARWVDDIGHTKSREPGEGKHRRTIGTTLNCAHRPRERRPRPVVGGWSYRR